MQPTTVQNDLVRPADPYQRFYDEFIELAAHDLSAPLRKLNVFTERLLNQVGSRNIDNLEEYVKRVQGSLAQLKSLVNSLYEYAKLLPHSMEWSELEAQALIEEAYAPFRERAAGENISFSVSNMPVIYGDRQQLTLLFRKLFENCVRYRKENVPLQINVSAIVLNEEASAAYGLKGENHGFRIVDNGKGIDDNRKDKIFLPLQKAHVQSGEKGNGLGLACVKRVAENHSGLIVLEKGCPDGCSFLFIIPQKA